jgi:hypothetical protein
VGIRLVTVRLVDEEITEVSVLEDCHRRVAGPDEYEELLSASKPREADHGSLSTASDEW